MADFLHGIVVFVGIVLLVIVGIFVISLVIFVPAMIARKCGTGVKIIVSALYILIGLAMVGTIIATPLAVLMCKQAFTTIWDEK